MAEPAPKETLAGIRERAAEPGERCTCGRQARIVSITDGGREFGWCGLSDGGDRSGPCPFCGGERHTRCPQYQLRAEES